MDSTPVVLIHGFAEDSAVWRHQAGYLKNRYQLLIPDLPPLASMEEGAEYIKSALDQVAIKESIMIGHSMGGYITLAFAEKYPERLKAAGLFHSSAYPDTEEKIAARRKGIEFIKKNGGAPFIRQSTVNLFSPITRGQHPEMVEEMTDRYSNFDPEVLIGYYEAMILRPDRTAVLRHFTKPLLFILGEHDSAVPKSLGLQQTHLPSISHIHILRSSAHLGMLEETDKANSILENFIAFNQASQAS